MAWRLLIEAEVRLEANLPVHESCNITLEVHSELSE